MVDRVNIYDGYAANQNQTSFTRRRIRNDTHNFERYLTVRTVQKSSANHTRGGGVLLVKKSIKSKLDSRSVVTCQELFHSNILLTLEDIGDDA